VLGWLIKKVGHLSQEASPVYYVIIYHGMTNFGEDDSCTEETARRQEGPSFPRILVLEMDVQDGQSTTTASGMKLSMLVRL